MFEHITEKDHKAALACPVCFDVYTVESEKDMERFMFHIFFKHPEAFALIGAITDFCIHRGSEQIEDEEIRLEFSRIAELAIGMKDDGHES